MAPRAELLPDQVGFFTDIHPTLLNPDDFTLPMLVQFPEGVPLARVERSLEDVISRHAALSSTFTRDAGGWRMLPGTSAACPPIHYVRAPRASAADRTTILDRLYHGLRGTVRLSEKPSAFALLDLGAEGCAVVGVVHHLVADAYSIRILGREMRQLAGSAALPPAPDYRSCVAAVRRYAHGETVRGTWDHWSRLPWHTFAELPKRPTESRYVTPPVIAAREMTISEELLRLLARHPLRAQETLLALVAKTLASHYGQEVAIAVVDSGRLLPDRSSGKLRYGAAQELRQVVGWFAITGLVVAPRCTTPDWPTYREEMSARLAVPPLTWGLLQRISAVPQVRELLRDGQYAPEVWFNYIRDETRLKVQQQQAATSAVGAQEALGAATDLLFRGIPLAFQARQIGGELVVTLTYDQHLYPESVVDRLAETWRRSSETMR